jgi:hypothetical protein
MHKVNYQKNHGTEYPQPEQTDCGNPCDDESKGAYRNQAGNVIQFIPSAVYPIYQRSDKQRRCHQYKAKCSQGYLHRDLFVVVTPVIGTKTPCQDRPGNYLDQYD